MALCEVNSAALSLSLSFRNHYHLTMSTKHLYDSSEGLVLKSLQGAVSLNPSLKLHQASKSVYTFPPSSQTKVSVISGGGAGHEPAHASYTGYGMLAASVSGEIFASPSAKQILSTIRLAAFTGGNGVADFSSSLSNQSPSLPLSSSRPRPVDIPRKDVLVIINNYTGDRLNFGLAIEKARAEGIRINSVVVADDISLLHSSDASTVVGPRGLAGNIIVCKILGALAERGSSLENLKWVGDAITSHLASIGVGLEHCHVPGSTKVSGTTLMREDECELGLGLHNEPGVRRMQMKDAGRLVDEMVGKILRSRGVVDGGRDSFVEEGDTTVLFVNNLGGMSQLEMGAVLTDILARLALSDIHPVRIYCSSFMTSLNAPGFSISLLNVSAINRTPRTSVLHYHPVDVLQFLDDPTEAHSWVGVRRFWPIDGQRDNGMKEQQRASEMILEIMLPIVQNVDDPSSSKKGGLKVVRREAEAETTHAFWTQSDTSPDRVQEGIVGACRAVIGEEKVLTEYDTIVGDGDCGMTFARGANAILDSIGQHRIRVSTLCPDELVNRVGDILEDHMGGTIGALFAIFFTAWAAAIKRMIHPSSLSAAPNSAGRSSSSLRLSLQFMDTLVDALGALAHHTPAQPGDRTLMDALVPLCTIASGSGGNGYSSSVAEEDAGIDTTSGTKAETETNIAKEDRGVGENDTDHLFALACKRAKEGAWRTKGMKPRLGRAVYVELKDGSERELPPDPGAWGIAVLAEGFWDGYCEK
ncbi:hypothetical protein D9757_005581 [Collybiopsis confluens]|uniref:Dihydroxyacetone kinase n=1 Tax=Collybiopsis confluens TaxID=2823264 RepID=A0A8H5HSR4_9AGAR|nr:hypothetical protein D9757_005581 [Collybiopsis confluens]